MRLVDGKQRQLDALEQREHGWLEQALGGDIDQVELAVQQVLLGTSSGFGIQAGVEHGSRHAVVGQRLDLVSHQRDQRRDHHRRARSH
jgi:hypothetical protein